MTGASFEKCEVRRAATNDVAAIRALTRAAYTKWISVIGREPQPINADYERTVLEHEIDLLFANHVLAGLIDMAIEPDHLLIVNIAVAPACQGRGFGRRLLTHAEERARALGLAETRLYTNKQFSANIALYLHCGYAIDREESFMGGVAVFMSKRMAAE